MSGFKLLAIRTGTAYDDESENIDFLKILKPYQFYKFYHDYTFFHKEKEVTNEEKVTSIVYKESVPLDLFNQEKLKVNVSAVVGKNGSGKSTLLELFFVSIYLLSLKYEQLEHNIRQLDEWEVNLNFEKIEYEEKKAKFDKQQTEISRLFDRLKKQLAKIPQEELKFFPGYIELKKKLNQYERLEEEIREETYTTRQGRWLTDYRREIERRVRSVDLEIYYELDGNCYVMFLDDQIGREVRFEIITSNIPKTESTLANLRDLSTDNLFDSLTELSRHFFYTIAISYSHYGLNVNDEGDWLNDLFHKNDSYQTPLVINPMRTEGNIDINKENNLAHQRLLSNLLEPVDPSDKSNLRYLALGKKATRLILRFNEQKFERYRERHNLSKITNTDDCISRIYSAYTGIELMTYNEPTLVGTMLYLNNKIIRICSVYERYKDFIKQNKFVEIPTLVNKVLNDRSHITFKLKQAMNFIRFNQFTAPSGFVEFEVDIEQLSSTIESHITDEIDNDRHKMTIEFLPPPTFDLRIQLEDGSFFDRMSSGEKQKIHSIGSIVYHLINLNSASKNGRDKSEASFCQYRYVNILFDEVEQYFHPDLQRTFISDLLETLNRINPLHTDKIEGINMLFATHSPFILSDIPSSNTLRIEEGFPMEKGNETFGANIYDLLEDSFYMNNGFIGGFSIKVINSILEKLNAKPSINEEEGAKTLLLIEIIGEPLLRDKLKSMYYEKYPDTYAKEREIQELTTRLNSLMQ